MIPHEETCTIGILVPATSVFLLREERVGDAYDVEPPFPGALTDRNGPWQVIYRYLRCTFHLILVLSAFPSRLYFVQIYRLLR